MINLLYAQPSVEATAKGTQQIIDYNTRWEQQRRCENSGLDYIDRGEFLKFFMRPFAEGAAPESRGRIMDEVAQAERAAAATPSTAPRPAPTN